MNSMSFHNQTSDDSMMDVMQAGYAMLPMQMNESFAKYGECVSDNTLTNESKQHINYLRNLSKNYRTQPCKNYHSLQGCGRERYCHFIHLKEFEGTYS